MKCITCHNEHDEKYCPNCGERNGVEKITFKSIIEDTFSSVTNMDKGFLYNFKTLFLKPKAIAVDYVEGKRKGVFNPVSYLIFSITIYLVVITVFKLPKETADTLTVPKEGIGKIAYGVGQFIRIYIKYFWVLAIIPMGLALRLMFSTYSYFEHLAISSFIIGQATLIGIISYLIFGTPLIFDPIVYMLMFWLIYRIFKDQNKIESFLRALVTLMLFVFQLFIIAIIIGVIKA